MADYKTPGVYVEEISVLPASVAQVETAIPAFIGYTNVASYKGKDLTKKATRISSFLEYQEKFGGEPARKFEVTLNDQNLPTAVLVNDGISKPWFMYDAVRMFYSNGGGDCYIVSVGTSGGAIPTADLLKGGIDAIKKVDEPTLIVVPDAISLATDTNLVHTYAISQCALLQDRFAVLDVKEGGTDYDADILAFRNGVGVNDLKYAAAYTPYIHSSLGSEPSLANVVLKNGLGGSVNYEVISTNSSVANEYKLAQTDKTGINNALDPSVAVGGGVTQKTWQEYFSSPATVNTEAEMNHYLTVTANLANSIIYLGVDAAKIMKNQQILTKVKGIIAPSAPLETALTKIATYMLGWNGIAPLTDLNVLAFALTAVPPSPYAGLAAAVGSSTIYGTPLPGTVSAAAIAGRSAWKAAFEVVHNLLLDILKTANDVLSTNEGILRSTDPIYSRIINAIKAEGLKMPPSGAIVGRYAEVDRTRGVWKAPANVSLNGVIGLSQAIDDRDQQSLNVDVTGGKSINCIRSFKGKGTLIWGARTLAGNDNEWRYVPVRRLFIMAEESIKKATEFVVFEPNDANTWGRTKAMIDNFLTGLWRDGALAGAKPDEAFYVNVGLGKTMTQQDILEGRLIIEIGMAAVRPAEFIILRFMHKLQES